MNVTSSGWVRDAGAATERGRSGDMVLLREISSSWAVSFVLRDDASSTISLALIISASRSRRPVPILEFTAREVMSTVSKMPSMVKVKAQYTELVNTEEAYESQIVPLAARLPSS